MSPKISFLCLLVFFSQPILAIPDGGDETRETMLQLVGQVQILKAELDNMRLELQNQRLKSEQLEEKFAELQSNKADAPQTGVISGIEEQPDKAPSLINLQEQEYASIEETENQHVLSNPWWKNIELYGFGAAGFYDTGSAGTRDNGSFEIKEATLFLEAEVWEDMSFFLELQTNRLGKDNDLFTRTGEIYAHFHDLGIGGSSIGLKAGRFDLPFGEEYLWQDAIDNPLITNSAAYPYGWDEGVLVYSSYKGLNWIAAITDGTNARSKEENSDKAFNLKVYGNPWESTYLSASFMANGDVSKSAIEFGGSHFEPVGDDGTLRGHSSSGEVDANMIEIDATQEFTIASVTVELSLSLGAAKQNDNNAEFDRDFRWFSIQPYLRISPRWYTVLRYSEIGTYDDNDGYHFDGKTFAGGNKAFGFSVKRFRRLGLGLGWMPNPRIRAKLEIGKDWYKLIDDTVNNANNDNRNFVGVEVAVGF